MLYAAAISFTLTPVWVLLFFAMVQLAIAYRYASIWLRAYMAGIPINFLEILGMTLRKVNANTVVQALIMAKQGGVTIVCSDLEMAYLQGVNLEKITLAMIEAKKQGIEVTFEELVDAEQEDRHRGE